MDITKILAAAMLWPLVSGAGANGAANHVVSGIHLVLQVDVHSYQGKIARAQLLRQSVAVVRHRLGSLTSKPVGIRQNGDLIEADIPGFVRLSPIWALVGPPQPLEIRIVSEKVSSQDVRYGRVPPDVEVLNDSSKHDHTKASLPVYREPLISGDQITDATNAIDENTGSPVVDFRLDARGSKALADITRKHIGEKLAIGLGNKIISAPVIREAITGGALEIDGEFTQDEAANLAATLRASAIAPPFRILNLSVVRFARD